jgi:hypothetical protein
MIMRTKNHPVILLLVAFCIFAVPAAGHADNLLRLFPEGQVNGFYGDNIGLQPTNQIGDFGTTLVAGFYMDYTSEARYASLHYDTFAQLFLHRSQLDRAGQGQYVSATDDENLSPTTKLHFHDFYYRDAPTEVAVTTSDQSPAFNTILAQLLFANFQASVNHFNAVMSHEWGRGWTSEVTVHQTTFFGESGNGVAGSQTSFGQGISTNTDYHFNDRFSLGAGYRFDDYRFTFPGRPDAQSHWPFGRITFYPIKDLFITGIAGVIITHTEGQGDTVNPGGIGLLEYNFHRGHISLYGGEQPELLTALGGVGTITGFRGNVTYEFTQRLTGSVGGGYYQSSGTGFNATLGSWGVGLSQRVNRYASVYARFVQLRVTETTTQKQLLPTGFVNGREAVGNYFVVGFNVSVEAFRWSWQ